MGLKSCASALALAQLPHQRPPRPRKRRSRQPLRPQRRPRLLRLLLHQRHHRNAPPSTARRPQLPQLPLLLCPSLSHLANARHRARIVLRFPEISRLPAIVRAAHVEPTGRLGGHAIRMICAIALTVLMCTSKITSSFLQFLFVRFNQLYLYISQSVMYNPHSRRESLLVAIPPLCVPWPPRITKPTRSFLVSLGGHLFGPINSRSR